MALRAAIVLGLALALAGCERTQAPEAGDAAPTVPMGTWKEWADLTPLVEIATTHADEHTVRALERASELLRTGQYLAADQELSRSSGTDGRHWIAVARADIAALNFTVCIRGVAWRLENGKAGSPTDRAADYSEKRRIEPGDISVEATLTNLDAATEAGVPALVTQARIARARVAAFASRCPPNQQVAELSEHIMEQDLAALAAESLLTPDLAYLWAGVQMTRFSGAAARPFLEQAREGGFDSPAVTYMLAVIALEGRDLDRADELATAAIAEYADIGDAQQQAQGWFIRGEIAAARKNLPASRKAYDAALKLVPMHIPSMIAVAKLVYLDKGEVPATAYTKKAIAELMLGDTPLEETTAREAASNVESLIIMADEPFVSQLVRDALLDDIDSEPDPTRRGIRYFYAATMDVRLREYEVAHGHAVLARDELAEADIPPPVDVEQFIERLVEATQ